MKGKVGIVITILLISILAGYSKGEDLNTISIVPQEKIVGLGETFTLKINITPVEPISSAACDIMFDPSILQAISVENGGMFDIWLGDLPGVAEIDNVNGTITYIIGASSEDITTEGTLAIITFQAISAGISYINIENAVIQGSTNVNIINGSVTVSEEGDFTPPDITLIDYPPAIINYRDIYFEWTATDDTSPEENITFSYMLDGYDTDPDATFHEFIMQHNSKYYFNQAYSLAGIYNFSIYARDVNGNEAISATYQFEIIEGDFIPPAIEDVAASPAIQDVGKNLTISASVTDNVAVEDVRINVTYPDGSYENFSIFQNKTDSIYYCIKSYNMTGIYEFYIYAIDTSGNSNVSDIYSFEIDDLSPPAIEDVEANPSLQNIGDLVNISCNVTDNVAVEDVRINVTYPDGSYENFSIFQNKTDSIYYSSRSYNLIGTYEFYIYAIDTSGNSNVSSVYQFEIEDLSPPHVEVVFPVGGEVVGGEVLIKWEATDNGEITGITIKYSPNNGLTWHRIVRNTENDGEYLWNTTGLEDGNEYLIQISAVDEVGNTGKDISAKFTVDNSKPSLAIEKPHLGKLYIFDREVLPILGQKAIIIGKITIVAQATDELAGIAKVEFYIDGEYKAEDTTTPYEWTWEEKAFGTHTVKVIAYDNAGNKKSEEVEIFVINPL